MSTSNPAIAISGAGCVLPSGSGVEAFWQAAREARSGIVALRARHFHSRRISAFGHVEDDVHQRCRQQVAANLQRYCAPAVIWGVSAVHQALHEAGLDPQGGERLRYGLYCCQGGYTHPSLDAYAELLQECREGQGLDMRKLARRVLQERALDPFLVLKSLSNGLLGVVSLACKLEAECNAYMQGVAGNQAALREACSALQNYRIDAAIVVGAGSELDALGLAALARAGVIGTQGATAFRPFDEEGQGGIAGEGAAALILRRREDLPEGPHTCLTGLAAHADIAELELPTQGVDLLVCSGTATPHEDRRLGDILARSGARHVTSSQPLTGILSGAPSLVDLILARSALRAQQVPALAGLRRPVSTELPFAIGNCQPARLQRGAVVNRDDNGFSACYRLHHYDTRYPAAHA
ncbi:beta-ketoacyl synthase N-terminal-like domain-containing protein [Pseudomonas sp. RIT-PI-AD]|uniref:beta-ketoacyl synthase N-terminal-like domain-containing protein n=1 Tax=Pseudomonas sp. RIT-PI-AD TaxID=3035294 RepID=UPI0021DA1B59|nr:beta-ketoacyl synthase N-terminal-like domain-containing protein [Pseudomonas sp. RIT-PI-AD]